MDNTRSIVIRPHHAADSPELTMRKRGKDSQRHELWSEYKRLRRNHPTCVTLASAVGIGMLLLILPLLLRRRFTVEDGRQPMEDIEATEMVVKRSIPPIRRPWREEDMGPPVLAVIIPVPTPLEPLPLQLLDAMLAPSPRLTRGILFRRMDIITVFPTEVEVQDARRVFEKRYEKIDGMLPIRTVSATVDRRDSTLVQLMNYGAHRVVKDVTHLLFLSHRGVFYHDSFGNFISNLSTGFLKEVPSTPHSRISARSDDDTLPIDAVGCTLLHHVMHGSQENDRAALRVLGKGMRVHIPSLNNGKLHGQRRWNGISVRDRRLLLMEDVEAVPTECLLVKRSEFHKVGRLWHGFPSVTDVVSLDPTLSVPYLTGVVRILEQMRVVASDFATHITVRDVEAADAEFRDAIRQAASLLLSLQSTVESGANFFNVDLKEEVTMAEARSNASRIMESIKAKYGEKPNAASLQALSAVFEPMTQELDRIMHFAADAEVAVDFSLRLRFRDPQDIDSGMVLLPSSRLRATPALLVVDCDSAVMRVYDKLSHFPFSNTFLRNHNYLNRTFVVPPDPVLSLTTHAPMRLRVIWDMVCVGCCGFSSELVHYLVPLSQMISTLQTSESFCFCPGYPRYVEEIISSSLPTTVGALDASADVVTIVVMLRSPESYSGGVDPLLPLQPDYVIGRSMFEFSRPPVRWVGLLNNHSNVNAVWVPCEFVGRNFEASGVQPTLLTVVPESVDTFFFDPAAHDPIEIVPEATSQSYLDYMAAEEYLQDKSLLSAEAVTKKEHLARQSAAKPAPTTTWTSWKKRYCNRPPRGQDAYRFLSVYKWEDRKGWDVLFQSYRDAFIETNDNVMLFVFTSLYIPGPADGRSPHNLTEIISQLRAFAASRYESADLDEVFPPFCVVVESVDETVLVRVFKSMDAFVLPTRGEGWGLPVMQAMSMAMPTIVTNWGGQTAFANETNSFLIDYTISEMTSVQYGKYDGTVFWAEPSVPSLVKHLRHVVRHQEAARLVGAAARDHIVRYFSEDAVAELMYTRFMEIYRRAAVRKPRRRS